MTNERLSPTDARILLQLRQDARLTIVALAERLRLARNTVQARMARLETQGPLRSIEHRVDHTALGYPIRAFIAVRVRQRRLDVVGEALATIPEVLEVIGITGGVDLHVEVVARDADDLYRVAGEILAVPDVKRTATSFAMRTMVPYRVEPLLRRLAESAD
jgi:DNA-binding Lrp family transcriptional regulator